MGGNRGEKGGKAGQDRRSNNNGDAMQVDTKNGVPTNVLKSHKCGKQGHKQKDCRQNNVSPNTNEAQNDEKPNCSHCAKPGHTAEQCFSNPNSSNFKGKRNHVGNGSENRFNNGNNGAPIKDKKAQQNYIGYVPEYVPPYDGEQTYCQICNTTDHSGKNCTFPTPHLYNSTMICRNCCAKGHTDADCRHPNPVNCTTCHRSGHKAEACRDTSAHFFKPGTSIINKDERFIWGSFDPESKQPGPKLKKEAFPSLIPQYQFEADLKNLEQLQQQGKLLQLSRTQQDAIEDTRQAVADRSIVKFDGQKEPLHFIPLRHANAVPAFSTQSRSFKVTKSQSSTKSILKKPKTVTWAEPGTNASNGNTTSDPDAMMALCKKMGIDANKFNAVYHRLREEQTSATERQVRVHIDRSARRYRKQNYNTSIQQLSLRIVENQVLSDKRHLEVKLAMARGWQFWRDPKAMEALVKHEQPVCYACAKVGTICDGHFRPINSAAACANGGVAVCQLEDYEDWGLFVVFECQCCNNGYGWVERPVPMVVDEASPATKLASSNSFPKASLSAA